MWGFIAVGRMLWGEGCSLWIPLGDSSPQGHPQRCLGKTVTEVHL